MGGDAFFIPGLLKKASQEHYGWLLLCYVKTALCEAAGGSEM